MRKIIFLNGCGSSGKTSLARTIQQVSDVQWLTFGVDTFIEMTPIPGENPRETGYFSFIPGQNERGPLMRVEMGPNAEQLFGVMPEFAKLLADKGNNLIIDEVLFDDASLQTYAECLKNHLVYFVGVFCDLAVMQARERLRADRAIGLSNDQIDRVHAGLRPYDLQVDTTKMPANQIAQQILEYIEKNPHPQGFETICKGEK